MSPPAKISITDALLQQTPCTDLSVVAGEAGTPWKLAWSSSTLDRERVHFGQLSLDGTWRELRRWRGIRPRVARCCGRAVVAFIGEREGRSAPALWSHGPQVDVLESNGYCHDIRLVGGDDFGWLALVERRGPRSFIRVGRVDHRVAWAPVAELPGDACALAERGGDVRLAWVDDEGVWVGRLDAGGLGGVVRVADQSGAEAPSLIADEGAWHLAWHAPVGDGVLSWLHVAIGRSDASGESWVVDHPPVDPQWIAAERADAAEDQGWMFPSLAVGPRGLWLAGRSANGFHVQLRAVDGWEPRREVSQPGWGGRSRTCALLAQGGQLYLLRGTPRGLSLGRLSMAAEADGADPAKTPALEPLPVLGASLAGAGRETSASGVGCVLFGDLHQHSVHSDGLASADSVYRRARDLYGHDFTALTDHESFCGKHIGPSTWRYQCELADALYEPGRFVTLKAYEFTAARQPGPGHKCVYFADRVPERLPPKDSDALERLLRDYGAFAVPHHIGWTGADLAHHDPELQPLFEICSVHGAYERAGERRVPPRADVVLPGQFIRDALAAGHRFGFIGGSDSHGLRWHHGLAHRADPWRCGLAGVPCEPTRESLVAALRARRCYATTGARIVLQVQVDGAPMGSVIDHGRPELSVIVHGTAPIARMTVVVDGEETEAAVAPGPPDRATMRQQLQARDGGSYCYVRVLQTDGEIAWSSPIWFGG